MEIFIITMTVCAVVVDGHCNLLLNYIGLDVFGRTFVCSRGAIEDILVSFAERLSAALCACDDPAYQEDRSTSEQEEENRRDPAEGIRILIILTC